MNDPGKSERVYVEEMIDTRLAFQSKLGWRLGKRWTRVLYTMEYMDINRTLAQVRRARPRQRADPRLQR